MEKYYQTFLEKIAEWFMQLFYDPMYLSTGIENGTKSALKNQFSTETAEDSKKVHLTVNHDEKVLAIGFFNRIQSIKALIIPDNSSFMAPIINIRNYSVSIFNALMNHFEELKLIPVRLFYQNMTITN